jgi:hypothetical protein
MPRKGTPAFYREEAARLTLIACDITDPATQAQLMEIAANFRKLCEFVAANWNDVETLDIQPA